MHATSVPTSRARSMSSSATSARSTRSCGQATIFRGRRTNFRLVPRSGTSICLSVWAAAEWALMVRACFVREEAGRLVVASGARPEWWREGGARFGATLTPFGPLTVHVEGDARRARIVVDGAWRPERVEVEVRLPGFKPQQRAVPSGPEEFQLSPSS